MNAQTWPEEPVDISDILPWWHRAWRRHHAAIEIVGGMFVGALLGGSIVTALLNCMGAS